MSSLACCGGTVATGTPLGTERKIGDLNCYVTIKEDQEIDHDSAIIFIADIFGYKLPNGRLIADKFAQNSDGKTICVFPDLFDGTDVPVSYMEKIHTLLDSKSSFFSKSYSVACVLWAMPGFMMRNPPAKSQKKIESLVAELKQKYKVKKIGAVGYCYGGTIACKLGQQPDTLDCFAANHFSGMKIPKDYEAIQKPCALIYSEIDFHDVVGDMPAVNDIMKSKSFPSLVKSYKQAHGFAIRGDDNDPEIKKDKDEVIDISSKFLLDILLK